MGNMSFSQNEKNNKSFKKSDKFKSEGNLQQAPLPNSNQELANDLPDASLQKQNIQSIQNNILLNSFSQNYYEDGNSEFQNNDLPKIYDLNSEEDPNLKVVSLIITIKSGESYDNLFRKVPQNAPEGRVALFEVDEKAIIYFTEKLKNLEFGSEFCEKNYEFVEKINEIFDYIEQLEPESILFNYECCSNCGDFNFLLEAETNELIDIVLKRKSNFMFSDFSVKSLLSNWDENLFGKNPFLKFAECSSHFNLKFDSEVLKKCNSPQLQIVGTLCENGECKIKVMPGTIVYGVNKEKIDQDSYDLNILTIIDNKNNFENLFSIHNRESNNLNENMEEFLVDINGKKGAVGHAILKYKLGGS